jgi:streptogramin lyase
VTDDAIWASVGTQLVRIDPATNEVTERIEVPDAGNSCPDCTGGDRGFWSFAIDGRAAWVSFHIDGASLVRKVSLDDGEIIADVTIESNGGEDVAVAFGSVWVSTCHASQVVRIDPTSNEVVGSVTVEDGPNLGDCNAMYLGVGAGSVWTAFGGGGSGRVAYVVRINPETLGTTTIHPQSGPLCGQMAVADDDLWVANCPGLTGQSIAQVDPRTDSEVGSVRFVSGYPGQPVIDGDLVWVPVVGISSGSLSIVAIDRATGTIVDEVDPGTTVRTRGTSAASAVAGFGSLWVNGADGALLRISEDDLRP